jgi:YbgC/YbaW family acyl-CoA thioester hydrolase
MAHEFLSRRKIEFSDTDMAGIVHFARFFVFMETAEHEFLNALGTSVMSESGENKIGWPRLSASCEYRRPLFFEDEVDIHLSVTRKGNKSLTYKFTFQIGDKIVAVGQMSSACCVCNPGESIRAIEIPKFIADEIEEAPASEA